MHTKELVKKYYEAFNARNWESFFQLLSQDVAHDANQGKTEIGKEAFRKFMHVMDEHYDEQVEELVVMVSEDGSRASAEFYIRGSYKKTQPPLPTASGQPYRLRVGAFFDVIDGKISRVTNYYNLQEWIKQVAK